MRTRASMKPTTEYRRRDSEMLCEAAGGPQHYSGRPMGDSHRHLMITEEEWLAFMDDVQQTLEMKLRRLWKARMTPL